MNREKIKEAMVMQSAHGSKYLFFFFLLIRYLLYLHFKSYPLSELLLQKPPIPSALLLLTPPPISLTCILSSSEESSLHRTSPLIDVWNGSMHRRLWHCQPMGAGGAWMDPVPAALPLPCSLCFWLYPPALSPERRWWSVSNFYME